MAAAPELFRTRGLNAVPVAAVGVVFEFNHDTIGCHRLDEGGVGAWRLIAVDIQPNEIDPREVREDPGSVAHLRVADIDAPAARTVLSGLTISPFPT